MCQQQKPLPSMCQSPVVESLWPFIGIFNDVLIELERAEHKHPNWPADRVRQAAVIAEEAGEALRAALSLTEYEEEGDIRLSDIERSYKIERMGNAMEYEVIQTAAMAVRWLLNYRTARAKRNQATSQT